MSILLRFESLDILFQPIQAFKDLVKLGIDVNRCLGMNAGRWNLNFL